MMNRYPNLGRFLNSIPQDRQDAVGPGMGFFVNKDSDRLDVLVHGVIGDDWDGLDSATLVAEMLDFDGDEIAFDINTPGGSVYDAMSIYTTAVEHGAKITATVSGQAASAGTIVASAADTIRISEGGSWMIHEAWIGLMLMGNKRELRPVFDNIMSDLEAVDEQIAQLLAARSDQDINDIREWMIGDHDGTTFKGQQAVDLGFADELIPLKTKKKAASRGESARIEALKAAHRRTCARQMARQLGVKV